MQAPEVHLHSHPEFHSCPVAAVEVVVHIPDSIALDLGADGHHNLGGQGSHQLVAKDTRLGLAVEEDKHCNPPILLARTLAYSEVDPDMRVLTGLDTGSLATAVMGN